MASDQGSRSRAGKGDAPPASPAARVPVAQDDDDRDDDQARDPAAAAADADAEVRRPEAEDLEDDDEEGGWPKGLVAVGGRLDADTLTRAYRAGIFPWSSDPEITWWSPDPRSIFDLPTFQLSRTVKKSIRRAGWTFSVDRDFEGVMRACAERTTARPSTWISEDFIAAYSELYRRGHAHSVEVYEGEQLVGGLYGVTFGAFFGGESMFHRRTDASKAAVAHLVDHLRARGFTLLDAQVPNPHLASIGAVEIPRRLYLERLRAALAIPATF
jgi:leucyl/phenylalanyl-tRNA---protein transferase